MDTIVIVDSDEKALQICKKISMPLLKEYDIRFVQLPEQAIDLLKEGIVKVLISELQLNAFTGEELMYMCEVISPLTVRVAMTNPKDLHDTLRRVNRCNVSGILLKPIQLADDIRNVIINSLKYYQFSNWRSRTSQVEMEDYKALQEQYSSIQKMQKMKIQNYQRALHVFETMIHSKLVRSEVFTEEENDLIEKFMENILESFFRDTIYNEIKHDLEIETIVSRYNIDGERSFSFKNDIEEISESRFGDMMSCLTLCGNFIQYVKQYYHVECKFIDKGTYSIMYMSEKKGEMKTAFKNKKLGLLLKTIRDRLLQMYSTKVVQDIKSNSTTIVVYFN